MWNQNVEPELALRICKMQIAMPIWSNYRPLAFYNPPALLLPTVLVNIIVVVVYFYPRIRIRYPEFILVVIIVVSKAKYKTLHSTSRTKLYKWAGIVDTASSHEPEGCGFESPKVFFLFFCS